MGAPEVVAFPADLSTLTGEELTALQTAALAEFDTLAGNDGIDDAGVARLETLADGIEAISTTMAAQTVAATVQSRDAQLARVRKARTAVPPVPPPAMEVGEPAAVAEVTEPAPVETPALEGEVVPAVTAGAGRPATSLAVAQSRAPQLPERVDSLVITAAAPTSNVQVGAPFGNLDALVAAVQTHSRSLVITDGRPGFQTVANIENRFPEVVDGDRTSLGEITRVLQSIRTPEALDSLTAGGGWCSPSEIRYDFFNIACEDGMVDLPTVGINRGGLAVPVSPSLANVFTGTFTNATNPWLWTEADDILTVTGAVNKPCVRVPCATFLDTRLECYGICLTAGNLTDSAWPEATRNFLKLLMSAHYHASNQRYLLSMVALSTAAIAFPTGSCGSIASDLPDRVGIAAQDYRTRHGLCDDDVVEVIVPRWARDAIRGDLARRAGDAAYLTMSNADIDALFALRRARIQWVADWQVRASGYPGGATAVTNWPTSMDFLVYAAGTFIRGNGMTLDLGVVRDSVLNAENDHTAAWTEECHLITKVGFESRLYRTPVCVGGLVGAGCTDCHTA